MVRQKVTWIAVTLVVIAVVVILGRRAAAYIPAFAAWVASLGALGPVAFILGYIVATVLFVPGSVLTLTAGAVFGVARGTLFVFIAASIGATAAFLIARYVARDAIARRIAHQPRFRAVDTAVAREGRKIAFLVRLSPLFPFNATNYAFGLTSIRLRDYVAALPGMLPVSLLWVYYGRLIGDVARIAAGARVERGAMQWVLLVAGLVATFLATAVLARAAKRALRASVAPDHNEQG